jgi:hypothetical protein
VALNVHATAAVFSTQIYVATNVVPQRQKIIGFNVNSFSSLLLSSLELSDTRVYEPSIRALE